MSKGFVFTKFRRAALVYALVAIPFGLIGYQATRGSSASTLTDSAVVLSMRNSDYHVGDTVAFTLTNNSTIPVYLPNHCPDAPLQVYKKEASNWVQLHGTRTGKTDCAGLAREYTIGAGKSIGATYAYWPDLFTQAGTYKLVADINDATTGPTVQFELNP